MPTGAAHVCSWGKTGSHQRIVKPTRLTPTGLAVNDDHVRELVQRHDPFRTVPFLSSLNLSGPF
jgi:hypothetical protein